MEEVLGDRVATPPTVQKTTKIGEILEDYSQLEPSEYFRNLTDKQDGHVRGFQAKFDKMHKHDKELKFAVVDACRGLPAEDEGPTVRSQIILMQCRP